MDTNIIVSGGRGELVSPYDGFAVPAIVADLGDEAIEHFVNFFTAEIENDNTKEAYGRAVAKFLQACEKKGLGLREIKPVTVAGYIKSLGKGKQHEVTSVKLYLAAIKRFLLHGCPSSGADQFRCQCSGAEIFTVDRQDALSLAGRRTEITGFD